MTKYIGITGHGLDAPKFHRQTLERFAFDTVLLRAIIYSCGNRVMPMNFKNSSHIVKSVKLPYRRSSRSPRDIGGIKKGTEARGMSP